MPKLTPGAQVTDMRPVIRAGMLTRVGQAVRYAIRGVKPDTWMSPAQPVEPAAPQIAGRRFDYPVGYNLIFTPRAGELTSFQQLRMLADRCDLVRLCIETRKDQLTRIAWDIQAIGGKKESDAKADAIIAMFKRPDGRNTWQSWLRMLVEEVLVTDAPAIYPRKTVGGDAFAFELLDGATIKVLADDQGRTPLPPSPAYQQVIKGMPAVDYTSDELAYVPRNPRVHKFYGYSPVEQVLLTVNIALRRMASQMQYFTEGNIPASFASVPKEWAPQQIEQFQKYWDSVIEGDQSYKRKVRFVPGDTKVTNLRDAPLKDDFDDWLARIVTYAFSLPPTQFTKQAVRTTSDTLQEASEEEGLAPIKAWVKDMMDHLIHHYLGDESHEFVWVAEDSMDPQSQASILDGYLKSGVLTVNEVREKIGEDRVENGDTLLIYTATGATPLAYAVAPPEPTTPTQVPTQITDAHTTQSATKVAADVSAAIHSTGSSSGFHIHAADAASFREFLKRNPGTHQHKADTSPLTPEMRKLKGAFKVALGEVRDAVLKQARGVAKAAGDGSKPDVPGKGDDWWLALAGDADLSGLSLALDDYNDVLTATTADGARHEVAALVKADPSLQGAATGAGFDMLDHQDPNAVEWAREHAAEMIGKSGDGGKLAGATRDMIRQAIAEALEAHDTDDEIAKALSTAYAFSDKRADLIARTEVGDALGAGSWIGAKALGMQQKSWLLSNDEGICPLCEANAAQGWIPINERFVSGAMYPLQHPKCRCDAAYRRKPKED